MSSSIITKPAFNNHLDLFQLSFSDVSVTNSFYIPVHSITNIREEQVPLEFNIPGLPGSYLDLAESYLYLRVKVTEADGKSLDVNSDVSTTNLFLHSLFDVVELYLGGKLITAKTLYHYSSYLLTHLSYSSEIKKDLLQSALYFEDNKVSTFSSENKGYTARKAFIKESQVVELLGPIYEDIFRQSRWILPNVDLRIKLKRSSPKFNLLAPSTANEYAVTFEDAVFYLKRHNVHQRIVELHEKTLERTKALYPFTLNQIKTVSIPQNSTNAVFENLFPSNKLPQVILIGLVDSEGFNAKYNKNPYNFEHFNLANLNLSVDQISLEYRNLNLTYDSNYLLAFQTLITGLNLETKSIGINRKTFLDGNVLYSFQLLGFNGVNSLIDKSGSVKLELTFTTPLAKQVTGICLAQSMSLMTIDKYRNVELENQGIL